MQIYEIMKERANISARVQCGKNIHPFHWRLHAKGVYLQQETSKALMDKRMTCGGMLCLWAALTGGCATEEEEKAMAQATEFAENYFNLRFDKAYECCTEDSREWIAFRASNITEKDLEAVRQAEEEAYVASADCERTDDSTALVRLVVREALAPDSLEQREGRIAPETAVLVPLRKEGRKWRVRMEGPLQNAE